MKIHASPEAIAAAGVDVQFGKHFGAFVWGRLTALEVEKLLSRGFMVDVVAGDLRVGATRVALQSPEHVASTFVVVDYP